MVCLSKRKKILKEERDLKSNMKNKITKKDIDNILANTLIKVEKYGDKTTVLKATLPNGFVVIENSSCIDPDNFDMAIGEQICMDKLVDKIYELEGYKLQSELNLNSRNDNKKRASLVIEINVDEEDIEIL